MSSWSEMWDAVQTAAAATIAAVDPYFEVERGGRPSSELQGLLRQFPSMAFIAALEMRPSRLEDVRLMGEWGVAQVICLDEEVTSIAIRDRVLSARGRPLMALLTRCFPPGASGTARAIVAAAVPVVVEGGSGADLARSLHVTLRTLLRWCRQAGLPAPKRLMAWMRILLAAELLDDPGRTVQNVAFACGYSSDASLRNTLRRFLRLTPSELRAVGAFQVASDAFTGELVIARRKDARYRRGRRGERRRT